MRLRLTGTVLALLVVWGAAGTAMAQQTRLGGQRFVPAGSEDGIFATEGADRRRVLWPYVALWAHYAWNPIVTVDANGNQVSEPVEHVLDTLRVAAPQAAEARARHRHLHDVADRDGEAPVDALDLWDVAEPRVAAPGDQSIGQVDRAEQRAQDGRLAAARGTDDADELTLRDRERDVLDRDRGAVGAADVFESNQVG